MDVKVRGRVRVAGTRRSLTAGTMVRVRVRVRVKVRVRFSFRF